MNQDIESYKNEYENWIIDLNVRRNKLEEEIKRTQEEFQNHSEKLKNIQDEESNLQTEHQRTIY